MTILLKDMLALMENPVLHGDPSTQIHGVTHDSRSVRRGWAFVAFPGAATDGHRFIADAVRSGASVVIAEKPPSYEAGTAAWVQVPDARRCLGPAAALVEGDPTSRLTLVGITGTNGKTTLTYLLEEIIKQAGGKPGVIGTVTYRWAGAEAPAGRTTPEASVLQSIFAQMVRAGVTHAFMEASSHGLHLGRLDGCRFDTGVFTNLSQDHLDYHGNLEEYFLAKRILFNPLLKNSTKTKKSAVVNFDNPYGRRLAREIEELPIIGFGSASDCHIRPERVSISAHGIAGTVLTPSGSIEVSSRLTGSFNLSNILAAVSVAYELGIPFQAIRDGIEAVAAVPGRLERVESERGSIFVDYAHTPDALRNVLDALKNIRTGRIITVMGCGGDRDKTKRPLMGREAAAASDLVVVTSDNPRTEDPAAIIGSIVEGVRETGLRPCSDTGQSPELLSGCYRVVPDRREAISWAVSTLQNGDILLVAGKGHETYQEINGIRLPFDDREVVREAVRAASSRWRSEAEGKAAQANR